MGMRKVPTITTAPLLWSGGQWSVFRPPIDDGDLSRAHAEHLIRNVAERYETQRQVRIPRVCFCRQQGGGAD